MVKLELCDSTSVVDEIDRGVAEASWANPENRRLLIEATTVDAWREAEAVMREWAGEPVEVGRRRCFEVEGERGRSVSVELSVEATNVVFLF